MKKEELLEQQLYDSGVKVLRAPLPRKIRGAYAARHAQPYILLNKALHAPERGCVLAHEAGHHYLGNLPYALRGSIEEGIAERRAARWAAHWLGMEVIISAWLAGCRSVHAMADALDVTDGFLSQTLAMFQAEYGDGIHIIHGYEVMFIPYFYVFEEDDPDEGPCE